MSKISGVNQRVARLRVIAGPNGSGKSSYFYQLKNEADTGVWINADELNVDSKHICTLFVLNLLS